MHRLLALLLLSLAPAAAAQEVHPKSLTVAVGDTVYATVERPFPILTGGMIRPTLHFTSGNPRIIRVQGSMSDPFVTERMRITGLAPGKARAFAASNAYVDVTVICRREPVVQPAEPLLKTKIGELVTLRAESSIAERTTFTWYHGIVGDMTAPIAASGPEIAFAAGEPGPHHVWVMATTPCSSSTAQFAIEAVAPKRRTARH